MKHLKIWNQSGNWRIVHRLTQKALPVPKGFKGPKDKASLSNNTKFVEAWLAEMKRAAIAPVAPGAVSAKSGTAAWLRIEYLASPNFDRLTPSMKDKIKRHVESFCTRYADILVTAFDNESVEKIFLKMANQPAKANQWLRAIRYLFKYAIKRKLRTDNPAADIKRLQPKVRVGDDGAFEEGHLTWPLALVTRAREKFPIGTEMRLAIEMINTLAFRRSDAIRVGLPNTYAGHLDDGRPATFIRYTQYKNRENKPVTVDTPIPAELMAIIKATKATGLKTWLVGKRGGSFTEDGFTYWFADEMAKAGMPKQYTPHGLRKRCLTDMAERGCTIHGIMAVSGHLTMKEVERYTRMADRAKNARAAMAGRL